MESDPAHWDEGVAQSRGYRDVVATPLFLLHLFRREDGTPDPLDRLNQGDSDWDGTDLATFGGLELPDLPVKRLLNGGTEAEFFQLACVGDVVSARTKLAEMSERTGKSGTMVLITYETVFTNQDGDLLAVVRQTMILR
jgi:hypothetical protein